MKEKTYIEKEEHQKINAQEWNLAPIKFIQKTRKPEDTSESVELKKINQNLEILKNIRKCERIKGIRCK